MAKKSPLQILATHTYTLEQRRKCPGSLDNLLAEHSCLEDVKNLFNLLEVFLCCCIFSRGYKRGMSGMNIAPLAARADTLVTAFLVVTGFLAL